MKIMLAVAVFLLSLPAWAEEKTPPISRAIVICSPGHWCRIVCPPVEGQEKWREAVEKIKRGGMFLSSGKYQLYGSIVTEDMVNDIILSYITTLYEEMKPIYMKPINEEVKPGC